jgi:hypothetical protein
MMSSMQMQRAFSKSTPARLCRLLLALALLLPSIAAEPRVSGSLSSATASVGESVEYTLTVEGGRPEPEPAFPTVDGLEEQGVGQNSSTIISGGSVNHTVTYTFRVVPRREGSFTIPPFDVVVEGRKMKTQEATLNVTPGKKTVTAGDFAFGEIHLSKNTAYVGEDVPVEFYYYLDQSARWSANQAPNLTGEGFTARRVIQSGNSEVEVGGKTYARLTLRTVITPSKAGKFSLGPAVMKFGYSKQEKRLYTPYGPGFSSPQELDVSAPAVVLDVKPLPVDGRPKDFTGAIGKFQFNAQGQPGRIKFGEPVSMILSISGRGNFERISAPPLADPTGWRAYPPEDKFQPNDQLELTGTKQFNVSVVPEVKKDAMPVFSFSYFDPEVEKYVTLTSQPAPLVIEGEAPAAPAEAAPAVEATPTPPPDILGVVAQLGHVGTYAFPTRRALGFAAAAAGSLVLAGLNILRIRRATPEAARRAALLRERAALLSRAHATSERAELLEATARALQLDVALATGRLPASIGLDEVLASSPPDPAVRATVEEVFAARAELLYAGGGSGPAECSPGERDRVLGVLATFERSAK